MKRKLLLILMLCIATVCFAMFFAACGESGENNGGSGENVENNGGNVSDNAGNSANENNDKKDCSHVYVIVVTNPTCTERGYTTYACKKCNDSFISKYTDSLGHKLQPHKAKAATCTEAGWEAYNACTRCDYTTYKEIKPLGHNLQSHKAKAATCTEAGWEAYNACTRCDYNTFKGIITVGHRYINDFCVWCNEQEPTYSAFDYTLKDDDTYEVKAKNKGITKAVIPKIYDGKLVTSVGEKAFYNCTLLTSITIPESITYIEDTALRYSPKLTNITVSSDNAIYKSIDGNLYSKDGKTLIKYAIGKKDASFTVPSDVTTIQGYAFYDCRSLTSVTIPLGVIKVGQRVFENCPQLTIYCKANGMPRGWDSYWNYGSGGVVWNCRYNEVASNGSIYVIIDSVRYSLKDNSAMVCCQANTIEGDIILPEKVTYNNIEYTVNGIANNAFKSCASLTSITIPGSVTTIGYEAFKGCASLTSITIPSSVTKIGSYAFENCYWLTDINFSGTMERWNAIEKGNSWNLNTGDYTVTCTDGKLDKYGNEIE